MSAQEYTKLGLLLNYYTARTRILSISPEKYQDPVPDAVYDAAASSDISCSNYNADRF